MDQLNDYFNDESARDPSNRLQPTSPATYGRAVSMPSVWIDMRDIVAGAFAECRWWVDVHKCSDAVRNQLTQILDNLSEEYYSLCDPSNETELNERRELSFAACHVVNTVRKAVETAADTPDTEDLVRLMTSLTDKPLQECAAANGWVYAQLCGIRMSATLQDIDSNVRLTKNRNTGRGDRS